MPYYQSTMYGNALRSTTVHVKKVEGHTPFYTQTPRAASRVSIKLPRRRSRRRGTGFSIWPAVQCRRLQMIHTSFLQPLGPEVGLTNWGLLHPAYALGLPPIYPYTPTALEKLRPISEIVSNCAMHVSSPRVKPSVVHYTVTLIVCCFVCEEETTTSSQRLLAYPGFHERRTADADNAFAFFQITASIPAWRLHRPKLS